MNPTWALVAFTWAVTLMNLAFALALTMPRTHTHHTTKERDGRVVGALARSSFTSEENHSS